MMQNLLIRSMLAPMGRLAAKVHDRVREGVFLLSAVALFLPCLLQPRLFPGAPYILVFAWGCLWTGMLILSVLPETLRPIRVNKPMFAVWVAFGLLVLISALRFNTDWLSEAIVVLIIVPVLSLVWGNCDCKRIFFLLRRACICTFVAYVILSALLVPIGSRQYGGLIPNVNGAAMYLSLVFACLLVECISPCTCKIRRGVTLLLTGMCFALIFYTNSRTGQLAAILSVLVVFAVLALAQRRAFPRRGLLQLICLVMAVAVMLPVTVYIIWGGNLAGAALQELIGSGTEVPPDGDGTQLPNLDSFLDYTGDKLQTGDKDLNAISTGRINIWKVYLQESTLFGTGKEERLWIESRDEYYVTAHMTLLTYAFRHGFVSALLFLVFNLLSGIRAIRYALAHAGEAWAMFPLAVTVTFGALSVLASVNTPFSYMVTIYYYFVQAPLFVKESPVLPADCEE